jgi:hypothetical protein
MLAGKHIRSGTLVFIYHIVPRGGTEGQALVVGNLYVSDVETALAMSKPYCATACGKV